MSEEKVLSFLPAKEIEFQMYPTSGSDSEHSDNDGFPRSDNCMPHLPPPPPVSSSIPVVPRTAARKKKKRVCEVQKLTAYDT